MNAQNYFPQIPQTRTLSDKLFVGVAIVGGGLFLKNILDESEKESKSDNAFSDENTSHALQLHALLHEGWFGWFEDENGVVEYALNISDYPKVSKIYREKYGVNLDEELSKYLNATELAQFKANLKRSGTSLPKTTPAPAKRAYGTKLYAKFDCNIRTLDGKSVLRKKKGEFFGTYSREFEGTIAGIKALWVVFLDANKKTFITANGNIK
jgi:hypothetical protein